MNIVLKDVWKSYDQGKDILKGINLDIEANDMVLIKGRSGSGKTTLLNLIGCIDTPSKGTIFLNGHNTGELTEKELANIRLHKIGIVFQAHNLINDLTVFENVLLPMKIANRPDGDWKARELLKTFELEDYSANYPN